MAEAGHGARRGARTMTALALAGALAAGGTLAMPPATATAQGATARTGLISPGIAPAAASSSPTPTCRTGRLPVQVKLARPPSAAKTGSLVTLKGKASVRGRTPLKRAKIAIQQRRSGGKWETVAHVRADRRGRFVSRVTQMPWTMRYRAIAVKTSRTKRAASAIRVVRPLKGATVVRSSQFWEW